MPEQTQEEKQPSVDSPTPQKKSTDNTCIFSGIINYIEKHDRLFSAISSVLIAVFTIILAISTIYLWKSTAGLEEFAKQQASDMKKSIKVAEDANQLNRDNFLATERQMNESVAAAKSSAISAEKSATVAEKTMVRTNRPWLSVRLKHVSGLKFNSDGGRIIIRFLIKNIGNSPAVGITIDERIILNNLVNIRNMRAEQKNVCDSGSNLHKSVGNMLFPGEEITYDVSSPISKDDIAQGKKGFYEAFKHHMNAINPVIIGCVRYGFTFDESRHRTSIMENLSKIDVKNPAVALLIDPNDGDVPPELIRLDAADYLGGNFAD